MGKEGGREKDDITAISGGMNFSEIVFIQMNRSLESLSSGDFLRAIAAVEGLEGTMAYYHDDKYEEEREELKDPFEVLRETDDEDIPIASYRIIKAKLSALIRLAGRRNLLPQGSPKKRKV